MKTRVGFMTVLFASIFFCQSSQAAMLKIENGSLVQLRYFLDADGLSIISEQKKADMKFVMGRGAQPPAFEQQLMGLRKGDTKDIKLVPDEAFGPYRQDLVKRIPKNQLPPSIPLVEGTLLGGKKGQHPIRIAKVLDDSIVLDENHPFAGKTLQYHVQITDVE